MRRTILHNITLCLAACSLLLLAACHSEMDITPDGSENATLRLNVASMGQTRAGTADLLDNEKMKSLRVIVLHADGTVEHNNYYSINSAEQEMKYIILKVSPSETKKIFLFANEESVTQVEGVTDGGSLSAFFSRYPKGAPGFADAVNGLYFAPDYTDGKVIPMSSTYEVTTPDKGLVEKTFYVVRVATKFTVNFINHRSRAVKIRSFSIASHADKNYLMAHVNSYPHAGTYASWIDWLKDVSDASSENDSYEVTNAAGWLKDYELPEQAEALTYTHGEISVPKPTGTSSPGKSTTVFYLPESKNVVSEATDGEQKYIMNINIEGKSSPDSFVLPNLQALFRNTHVVININMYMYSVDITLRVKEWHFRSQQEIYM